MTHVCGNLKEIPQFEKREEMPIIPKIPINIPILPFSILNG